MKKVSLYLAVIVFLFANAAFAQIQKGAFLVGASSNFGYSSTSYENSDDNVNLFSLNLKGGYFVIDDLTFGLSFGYNKFSVGDNDASTTSVGFFGRYYVNGKFFAGMGYNSSKAEGADAINRVPFEIGYAAFLNNNIAVEPSLSYAIGVSDNKSNQFALNVGFALYFNR